jgi:hypothetical protein
MDTQNLGRILLAVGALIMIVGGVLLVVGRGLPGDIRFQRGNVTCFFPLTTMIILSIVLTVILNLVIRWINR